MKRVKDLPIGSKIKDVNTKYLGAPITWMVVDKNHVGYPENSVTLISDKILCYKCFDFKEKLQPFRHPRQTLGNERYAYSNILSWLNGRGVPGEWYTAKHDKDWPPDAVGEIQKAYINEGGFLNGFDPKFLQSILNTTVQVQATDNELGQLLGTVPDNVTSKVFLPAKEELGLKAEWDSTRLLYFSGKEALKAVPTPEAKADNPSVSESYFLYMLRSPRIVREGTLDYVKFGMVHVIADLNDPKLHISLCMNELGVRPMVNVKEDMLVGDHPDSDGAYVIKFNSAPVISGEDKHLGEKNEPFEVSYSVSDVDVDDEVTITEYLNGSLLRTLQNANNTTQTISITPELLNSSYLGDTNTIEVQAADNHNHVVYRRFRFIRTNLPPEIDGNDENLGELASPPTVTFKASDPDGNKMSATIKLNQRVIGTIAEVKAGELQTYKIPWKEFMRCMHSMTHHLWIEVRDTSGGLAIRRYTFTRKVTEIVYEAKKDIGKAAEAVVFSVDAVLGASARMILEVSNDANLPGAHWVSYDNGMIHRFNSQPSGATTVGFRVKITRGTSLSALNAIGGSYL